MDPNERKGWMEVITSEALDTHMAAIGQSQANAQIVKDMFRNHPLLAGSKLIIPGCGTGQLFDYIAPSDLGEGIELTFTDINSSYLQKVQERLSRFPNTKYNTKMDDIEKTTLEGRYEGILIVLVLQHVEWKRALDSMSGLGSSIFYIIIQEQDPAVHAVTKNRNLSTVWEKYAELANPHLVPRAELISYATNKGYDLIGKYKRNVPDNKTMTGLVFKK